MTNKPATPKTQSVCKYCQQRITLAGAFWYITSRLKAAIDSSDITLAGICGKNPNFSHEPVAEPASTGEPKMSERKPNTMYCDKCNKEMPNLALGPCSCGSSTFSGTMVAGAARPSGPSAILQDLRNYLACDGCGREKYFAGNKKWLHSHSNIEMCDDEDCKKFEAICERRPSVPECNCGAGPHLKSCSLGLGKAAPQPNAEPPQPWPEPICKCSLRKSARVHDVKENGEAEMGCHVFEAAPQLVSGDAPLTTDELLVILMEECAEVIKAASKCLRFGYTRNHPSYGDNDKVLSTEIGDLLGVVEALPLDGELMQEARKTKIERAEKAKVMYGK